MTQDIDKDDNYLWLKRHDAFYKAELSALYHQKRGRFFDLCDKLGKAVSVIGGSATLWKIGSPDVVSMIAGIITLTSAFSLVFSFSERSRRHAELARNFRQIIYEITAKGERDYIESDINTWMSKLCALDATEAPSLSVLTIMCQNELAIARGESKSVHPLNLFERMFVHIFDMPRTV